eukprot:TRINITY_DN200_c0_g1_i1.p1 TRINITY_DN200_c0_g1~~TRINITY_DN200_c0_g1_i1.p1  ORF type:complete len:3779 (-),score=501.97 TRINITY_DN200_c0_g1_i1:501-11837(-)
MSIPDAAEVTVRLFHPGATIADGFAAAFETLRNYLTEQKTVQFEIAKDLTLGAQTKAVLKKLKGTKVTNKGVVEEGDTKTTVEFTIGKTNIPLRRAMKTIHEQMRSLRESTDPATDTVYFWRTMFEGVSQARIVPASFSLYHKHAAHFHELEQKIADYAKSKRVIVVKGPQGFGKWLLLSNVCLSLNHLSTRPTFELDLRACAGGSHEKAAFCKIQSQSASSGRQMLCACEYGKLKGWLRKLPAGALLCLALPYKSTKIVESLLQWLCNTLPSPSCDLTVLVTTTHEHHWDSLEESAFAVVPIGMSKELFDAVAHYQRSPQNSPEENRERADRLSELLAADEMQSATVLFHALLHLGDKWNQSMHALHQCNQPCWYSEEVAHNLKLLVDAGLAVRVCENKSCWRVLVPLYFSDDFLQSPTKQERLKIHERIRTLAGEFFQWIMAMWKLVEVQSRSSEVDRVDITPARVGMENASLKSVSPSPSPSASPSPFPSPSPSSTASPSASAQFSTSPSPSASPSSSASPSPSASAPTVTPSPTPQGFLPATPSPSSSPSPAPVAGGSVSTVPHGGVLPSIGRAVGIDSEKDEELWEHVSNVIRVLAELDKSSNTMLLPALAFFDFLMARNLSQRVRKLLSEVSLSEHSALWIPFAEAWFAHYRYGLAKDKHENPTVQCADDAIRILECVTGTVSRLGNNCDEDALVLARAYSLRVHLTLSQWRQLVTSSRTPLLDTRALTLVLDRAAEFAKPLRNPKAHGCPHEEMICEMARTTWTLIAVLRKGLELYGGEAAPERTNGLFDWIIRSLEEAQHRNNLVHADIGQGEVEQASENDDGVIDEGTNRVFGEALEMLAHIEWFSEHTSREKSRPQLLDKLKKAAVISVSPHVRALVRYWLSAFKYHTLFACECSDETCSCRCSSGYAKKAIQVLRCCDDSERIQLDLNLYLAHLVFRRRISRPGVLTEPDVAKHVAPLLKRCEELCEQLGESHPLHEDLCTCTRDAKIIAQKIDESMSKENPIMCTNLMVEMHNCDDLKGKVYRSAIPFHLWLYFWHDESSGMWYGSHSIDPESRQWVAMPELFTWKLGSMRMKASVLQIDNIRRITAELRSKYPQFTSSTMSLWLSAEGLQQAKDMVRAWSASIVVRLCDQLVRILPRDRRKLEGRTFAPLSRHSGSKERSFSTRPPNGHTPDLPSLLMRIREFAQEWKVSCDDLAEHELLVRVLFAIAAAGSWAIGEQSEHESYSTWLGRCVRALKIEQPKREWMRRVFESLPPSPNFPSAKDSSPCPRVSLRMLASYTPWDIVEMINFNYNHDAAPGFVFEKLKTAAGEPEIFLHSVLPNVFEAAEMAGQMLCVRVDCYGLEASAVLRIYEDLRKHAVVLALDSPLQLSNELLAALDRKSGDNETPPLPKVVWGSLFSEPVHPSPDTRESTASSCPMYDVWVFMGTISQMHTRDIPEQNADVSQPVANLLARALGSVWETKTRTGSGALIVVERQPETSGGVLAPALCDSVGVGFDHLLGEQRILPCGIVDGKRRIRKPVLAALHPLHIRSVRLYAVVQTEESAEMVQESPPARLSSTDVFKTYHHGLLPNIRDVTHGIELRFFGGDQQRSISRLQQWRHRVALHLHLKLRAEVHWTLWEKREEYISLKLQCFIPKDIATQPNLLWFQKFWGAGECCVIGGSSPQQEECVGGISPQQQQECDASAQDLPPFPRTLADIVRDIPEDQMGPLEASNFDMSNAVLGLGASSFFATSTQSAPHLIDSGQEMERKAEEELTQAHHGVGECLHNTVVEAAKLKRFDVAIQAAEFAKRWQETTWSEPKLIISELCTGIESLLRQCKDEIEPRVDAQDSLLMEATKLAIAGVTHWKNCRDKTWASVRNMKDMQARSILNDARGEVEHEMSPSEAFGKLAAMLTEDARSEKVYYCLMNVLRRASRCSKLSPKELSEQFHRALMELRTLPEGVRQLLHATVSHVFEGSAALFQHNFDSVDASTRKTVDARNYTFRLMEAEWSREAPSGKPSGPVRSWWDIPDAFVELGIYEAEQDHMSRAAMLSYEALKLNPKHARAIYNYTSLKMEAMEDERKVQEPLNGAEGNRSEELRDLWKYWKIALESPSVGQEAHIVVGGIALYFEYCRRTDMAAALYADCICRRDDDCPHPISFLANSPFHLHGRDDRCIVILNELSGVVNVDASVLAFLRHARMLQKTLLATAKNCSDDNPASGDMKRDVHCNMYQVAQERLCNLYAAFDAFSEKRHRKRDGTARILYAMSISYCAYQLDCSGLDSVQCPESLRVRAADVLGAIAGTREWPSENDETKHLQDRAIALLLILLFRKRVRRSSPEESSPSYARLVCKCGSSKCVCSKGMDNMVFLHLRFLFQHYAPHLHLDMQGCILLCCVYGNLELAMRVLIELCPHRMPMALQMSRQSIESWCFVEEAHHAVSVVCLLSHLLVLSYRSDVGVGVSHLAGPSRARSVPKEFSTGACATMEESATSSSTSAAASTSSRDSPPLPADPKVVEAAIDWWASCWLVLREAHMSKAAFCLNAMFVCHHLSALKSVAECAWYIHELRLKRPKEFELVSQWILDQQETSTELGVQLLALKAANAAEDESCGNEAVKTVIHDMQALSWENLSGKIPQRLKSLMMQRKDRGPLDSWSSVSLCRIASTSASTQGDGAPPEALEHASLGTVDRGTSTIGCDSETIPGSAPALGGGEQIADVEGLEFSGINTMHSAGEAMVSAKSELKCCPHANVNHVLGQASEALNAVRFHMKRCTAVMRLWPQGGTGCTLNGMFHVHLLSSAVESIQMRARLRMASQQSPDKAVLPGESGACTGGFACSSPSSDGDCTHPCALNWLKNHAIRWIQALKCDPDRQVRSHLLFLVLDTCLCFEVSGLEDRHRKIASDIVSVIKNNILQKSDDCRITARLEYLSQILGDNKERGTTAVENCYIVSLREMNVDRMRASMPQDHLKEFRKQTHEVASEWGQSCALDVWCQAIRIGAALKFDLLVTEMLYQLSVQMMGKQPPNPAVHGFVGTDGRKPVEMPGLSDDASQSHSTVGTRTRPFGNRRGMGDAENKGVAEEIQYLKLLCIPRMRDVLQENVAKHTQEDTEMIRKWERISNFLNCFSLEQDPFLAFLVGELQVHSGQRRTGTRSMLRCVVSERSNVRRSTFLLMATYYFENHVHLNRFARLRIGPIQHCAEHCTVKDFQSMWDASRTMYRGQKKKKSHVWDERMANTCDSKLFSGEGRKGDLIASACRNESMSGEKDETSSAVDILRFLSGVEIESGRLLEHNDLASILLEGLHADDRMRTPNPLFVTPLSPFLVACSVNPQCELLSFLSQIIMQQEDAVPIRDACNKCEGDDRYRLWEVMARLRAPGSRKSALHFLAQNGASRKALEAATQMCTSSTSNCAACTWKAFDLKLKMFMCCDDHGNNPLHIAASSGALHFLRFVRKFFGPTDQVGVDDKQRESYLSLWREGNSEKDTMLHLAAREGHYKVMDELVMHTDLKVNATNLRFRTPLHEAVRRRRDVIAFYLVSSGANLFLADDEDRTPFLLCFEYFSQVVVEDLLSVVCRTEPPAPFTPELSHQAQEREDLRTRLAQLARLRTGGHDFCHVPVAWVGGAPHNEYIELREERRDGVGQDTPESRRLYVSQHAKEVLRVLVLHDPIAGHGTSDSPDICTLTLEEMVRNTERSAAYTLLWRTSPNAPASSAGKWWLFLGRLPESQVDERLALAMEQIGEMVLLLHCDIRGEHALQYAARNTAHRGVFEMLFRRILKLPAGLLSLR